MENLTYKIVRSWRDNYNVEIIKTGLTLKEAQAHCRDKNTKGDNDDQNRGPWFDGYEREQY